MLKAIITVWTFAFGLILVATLAGCGGDTGSGGNGGGGGAVDQGSTSDKLPACPTACGTCGADEFCFSPASVTVGLPPFCAHQCADSRDCKAGEKCTDIFASRLPPVCVSATLPEPCGEKTDPRWICDFAPAQCIDANTLHAGYSQPANRTCGYERIHCDNGCDSSTSPAHCK